MIRQDTYQAFQKIWNYVAYQYNLHPDRIDHYFLPAYECALRNYNASRGPFNIYAKFIIRGHLTRYLRQCVFKSNKAQQVKDALYPEDFYASPEEAAAAKDFTKRLLDKARLTPLQKKAVEHLIMGDMELLEFTSKFGSGTSRQAGGEVKRTALKKLRAAYKELVQ
jgi:hypothetical protein